MSEESKIPELIHHSRQFQQMDLGENIYLFKGEGPGEARSEVGEIYNFDQFPCLDDEQCEDFEAMAVAFADKVAAAYNCHDELVLVLWEILYADNDNHIPDHVHKRGKAVLDKAKGETR